MADVQISDRAHIPLVGTIPANARLQIYFKTEAARKQAVVALERVLREMVAVSAGALERLRRLQEGVSYGDLGDRDSREEALRRSLWHMDDPQVQMQVGRVCTRRR